MILADIVQNATYPGPRISRANASARDDGLKVALKDPGRARRDAGRAGRLWRGALRHDRWRNAGEPRRAHPRRPAVSSARPGGGRNCRPCWCRAGSTRPRPAASRQKAFGDWRVDRRRADAAGGPRRAGQPARTLVVDLPGSGQAAVYAVARGITAVGPGFYARIARQFGARRLVDRAAVPGDPGQAGAELRRLQQPGRAARRRHGRRQRPDQERKRRRRRQDLPRRISRASRPRRSTPARSRTARPTWPAASAGSSRPAPASTASSPAPCCAGSIRPKRWPTPTASMRCRARRRRRAWASWSAPDRISIVIVGDAAKFVDKLKAIRPDVQVVPAAQLDLASRGGGGGGASRSRRRSAKRAAGEERGEWAKGGARSKAFSTPSHTVSYLVWDEASRQAAVIDPVLDFNAASGDGRDGVGRCHPRPGRGARPDDRLVAGNPCPCRSSVGGAARRRADRRKDRDRRAGWPRSRRISGRCSALRPQAGDFDRLVADGDRLPLGGLEIEVIAVPGHTPADVAYRIGDAVFVGDSLFMPDYGSARCDFPGGSAHDHVPLDPQAAEPAGRDAHVPVPRLQGAGPRRASPGRRRVGEQRAGNVHLHDGVSEDEFVALREGTRRDARRAGDAAAGAAGEHPRRPGAGYAPAPGHLE